MLAWNLLVLKQTQKQPWTSGQTQGCYSLIYHGPCVASTNKVIIPLNSVFCKCFLLSSAKTEGDVGLLEKVDSDISAFEDEETFPEFGAQGLPLGSLKGQEQGWQKLGTSWCQSSWFHLPPKSLVNMCKFMCNPSQNPHCGRHGNDPTMGICHKTFQAF